MKMKSCPNFMGFDEQDDDVVNIMDRLAEDDHKIHPKYSFKFDRVFKPETYQTEIFESVAKDIIEDAFAGYNSTVLAYGQTGSGKTYTMFGPEIKDSGEVQASRTLCSEDAGIIPRVASQLFKSLRFL